MIMEISKERKLCHVQSRNKFVREDRISSLPDAILHQILSYFPTDQVVRFSLLSTRWKYLWTSIPNLHFSLESLPFKPLSYYITTPEGVGNFQNFVDRVLTHHAMSNIHKFHLYLLNPLHLSGSHLDAWFSILSRHKLRELVLLVSIDDFTFPSFLSTFKSLTVLEFSISSVLCVPSSICFPNLKNLQFNRVRFSCDESTQEVSFTFPVLEELTVYNWDWLEIKTVNIFAPALKKFMLDGGEHGSVLCETEIKVDAINLIALSILGCFIQDYSLSYLPSLVEASVDVDCDYDNQRLVKFVTTLNHVKNLTLSDDCIQQLFSSDTVNNMQMFANLISLSVTNRSENFSAKCLIDLLCYVPNIECLSIEVDTDDYYYYDDEPADTSWTHETIPQCSLLNLKSVEIKYCKGNRNELCLIAYLLVRTLEKMIITFNFPPDDPERKNTILTEVLMLPRGSAGTELIVR